MKHTKTWEEQVAKLEAKEAEALRAGGEERLQKHRDRGKMTARERIDYILDPGSFVELNMLAEHDCRDFGMDEKKYVGDGVVTGYGTIEGRKVYIYAQDSTVMGGSTGKVHGAKIHNVLRLAREHMVPVICLNDSAGARLQEGMSNVYGINGMFHQNTLNSGIVPQIAAVMGACTGGAAYSSALCDFIVQVEKTSYLFVSGPAVVQALTGEAVAFEDLGGAEVHATKSGVTHLTAKDDRECLDLIRQILAYLPKNNMEKPARRQTNDPSDRETPELMGIVPVDRSETYDMRRVIRTIVDDGEFLEIQPGFARNLHIGFAHMGGRAIGIVANNPQHLEGRLDIDSSNKAARFVRTCDVFNIPVVCLVDVAGFVPGVDQEHGGIIRHGAKMLHAWTEITVPKISCVLRKMYGGGIPAMGVRQMGIDQMFAWPTAEMQIVGAEPSVKILYRRELDAAEDPEAFLNQKIEEYENLFLTPYHAAALSVIDAVIHPRDTRKRIISAIEIMENKAVEPRPFRKHTNIPL